MEQFIKTKVGVNFRKGPGTSYSIIKVLPIGTTLEVIYPVDNTTWYYAKLEDGTLGYISSLTQYVEAYTPDWLAKAKDWIAYAEKFLGVEYEFGSSRSNSRTFDCSDFTKWTAEHSGTGLKLGSSSRDQSVQGFPVKKEDLRTGDLVFYSKDTDGNKVDDYVYHVGIYVHPGRTLHTYKVGIGVTYSPFEPGDYWYNQCDFGRRVL